MIAGPQPNLTPRTPLNRRAALDEFRWAAEQAISPRIRKISQFAEQEIVLPSGPDEGLHFRLDRQPFSRIWFTEIESRRWNRHVFTGPQQIGKTLLASLIPLLYHLFEVGERVIFGLPNMEMAGDKWRDEILPVIERTRYRDLLPRGGGGSRGGKVEAIKFRHGRTLKFMSGGGSDKRRASYTSRVLIVTEIDDLDSSGGESDEADKLKQMEGRTRAYGDRKCIYLECTVSTELGRTWSEYTGSTHSRLAIRCPHCSVYVVPEREQLMGWQDAASEFAAKRAGHFVCPGCAAAWSEADRHTANQAAVLLHRDQSIDAQGEILGPDPQTQTLGFRVSAVHNTFITAGDAAAQEFKGAREEDEDNAEKELCQWLWAVPHQPTLLAATPLTNAGLMSRIDVTRPRGEVHPDAQQLVAVCDLGKWELHWVFFAFRPGATPDVVDYGKLRVPSHDMTIDLALRHALLQFEEELAQIGWIRQGTGDRVHPDLIIADSRYYPDSVIGFCRERSDRWLAAQGYGRGKRYRKSYTHPKTTNKEITEIGDNYYVAWDKERQTFVLSVNADHWKSHLHERLATPMGQPGAMTLFRDQPREHLTYVKHLTAERQTLEFVPGVGEVAVWEVIRRANHWLDCSYNACTGARYLGAELIPSANQPAAAENGPHVETPTLPDGRKYFVSER